MRKIILLILLVTMVLAFAACNKSNETAAGSGSAASVVSETSMEIPNPWTENKDLKEANANAGTSFALPDEYKTAGTAYRSLKDDILEINTSADNMAVTFRSAKGAKVNDISGDYNTYSNVREMKDHGIPVTIKSNSEGTVSIAIWNDGNANFSVSFANEVPETDAVEVVSSLIEANTMAY